MPNYFEKYLGKCQEVGYYKEALRNAEIEIQRLKESLRNAEIEIQRLKDQLEKKQ